MILSSLIVIVCSHRHAIYWITVYPYTYDVETISNNMHTVIIEFPVSRKTSELAVEYFPKLEIYCIHPCTLIHIISLPDEFEYF